MKENEGKGATVKGYPNARVFNYSPTFPNAYAKVSWESDVRSTFLTLLYPSEHWSALLCNSKPFTQRKRKRRKEKKRKEKKRATQLLVPNDFLIARVPASASLQIFMCETKSCFVPHNTVYT